MDFTGLSNKTSLYRGFSSFLFEDTSTFTLTDAELIKTDIMNHIFTLKGERIMMPNFGTIIPELVFEPLDGETVEILIEEVRKVIMYDPRVALQSINAIPDYDKNTITVYVNIKYVELDVTEGFNFNIEFDNG